MKKIVSVILMLICIISMRAQEKKSFRIGLDIGYAMHTGDESLFPSIEAKYNITDKSSIGLRFGGGSISTIRDSDLVKKEWSNYSVTYDSYFHKEGALYATFLGAGIGVYKVTGYQDVTMNGSILFIPFSFTVEQEVSNENKIGLMLRGGVELGKFRLALEYNLVPKTNFDGGEIKNSYIGLSIGSYLGGGKWKLN